MVKVDISNNGFIISGHADYAEYGYDIVCSAISALAQTIFLSMRERCNVVDVNKYRGFMYVEVEECEYSALLLRTLYIGIREIEKTHPNCVELNVKSTINKEMVEDE